ncbi:MAG: N-6 DNA methylase [Firmicutes bacterium]|nr:N-6 DNA methylase [Candidatus Caballimonas caccae]
MAEINKIIKNARDVLVGKVPDPQSQVDQITLALIYKFMDAKDKEAQSLNLPKTFFINDCEPYSFTKVMQASDNETQFKLYNKGIELLQYRQDLPETFISVFKDAFIPYRDALTLHLFLAEINKIPTDNTELLGTAFEDLLSIMGSQGDAGQFRTPRHIIDMIVDIVEPKIGETILDPACGTAGFLISAYNKVNKQDMTVEERENFITNGLVGYDINPNMVKLSNVNLFLHGCKKPNIHLYDTLSEKDYWKDNFDIILANPPFMTPKGGIRPHELFSAINANRSEVLFTYYIAKHLKRAGRAGFIVPEGVVFQTANAYKDMRRILIEENYLYAVISLPSGVFNPYSGVKTSVLLLDRNLAKKTDKVLFVKMNNDGFDLGAQRRPIEKNDIPAITEIVKSFAFAVSTETENDFVDNYGLSTVVSKEEIIKNDFVLVGDRYSIKTNINSKYDLFKIGNCCEVLDSKRRPITKSDREKGTIPYYGATGVVDNVKDYIFDGEYVLVGEDGAKWGAGENTAYKINGKTWVNNHAHILKCNREKILDTYLVSVLNYMDLSPFITGITVPKLTQEKLRNIEIPLPPIERQKEIVAEIEQYQKIIDGAKQVVDNYKPSIKIESSWEKVKLNNQNLFDIESGGTPSSTNEEYWNGEINWATLVDLPAEDYVSTIENTQRKITKKGLKESSAVLLPSNSILISSRATIGRVAVNKLPTATNQGFKNIIVRDSSIVNFKFLAYLMKQYAPELELLATGGTFKEFSKTSLGNFEIQLPSIENQNTIVEEIEKEEQIIAGNKELIKIYEQKINDILSSIWEK